MRYRILGIIWKLLPNKMLKTIIEFHFIEDDSHWQIMQYINHSTPSGTKKYFCIQAIEERGHAQIFKSLYQDMTKNYLPQHSPERSMVLGENKDYKKFGNMCDLGETAALKKFIEIHKILPTGIFKKKIHQIIKDEIQHSNQFKDLKIDRDIRVNWWKTNFLSIGVRTSTTLINIFLSIIYFCLFIPLALPISIITRLRR